MSEDGRENGNARTDLLPKVASVQFHRQPLTEGNQWINIYSRCLSLANLMDNVFVYLDYWEEYLISVYGFFSSILLIFLK